MKPGVATLELKALQNVLLEAGFAKFKLPERVKAFEKIPRNAMGKVQRFMLEELVSTQTNEKQEGL
jgi:cyclohexanecarboxylate-CoA ligase